jgi:topoisomerase-4 subunit A
MAKSIKQDFTHSDAGISGQYKTWFLDYASYVILERAVPAIGDGLKPVQRRILHAMKEMDDGRFNKVANIIGQSMQYHPHGDASIGDALVNLGQKELLIDTQGNWGDVRTGDDAAAPRYIEARLSKFALEVAFNNKTTHWQLSYDGRKNEPVTLPMKFPLLLAQGADSIAVGLATKILPHNFCELIEATIKYYKGKKIELFPDFTTGGMIDVTNYNNGIRGGKVRVRARIEEQDKKTLLIKDVPYGTTTTQLIDSIIKANENGKIKIKKVTDNTAAEVEVSIDLAPGISPDITIDALYAFTDCEIAISPNACVINGHKAFLPFKKLLKRAISREDILKLTEKPVRRIYRLDIEELNQQIRALEGNIKQVNYDLENLTQFAISYYEELLKKYGKGRQRRTEIKLFDTIQAKAVAIANTKIYVNRAEGFIGIGLKKDEFVADCSDLDDIIAFTKSGIMKVVKVADKVFIGKDIIHVAVFNKSDERTTYNMIYAEGKNGISYAKRFNVTGVTRDKEYDLTKGEEKSKVHYFSVNPNGEAEAVRIVLTPGCSARYKELDFSFETLDIRSRNSIGNQVTKYAVKTVRLLEKGRSTLDKRKLWFDGTFGRLNTEGKGSFLGTFDGDDKIIVISKDGNYEITGQELTQRFETGNILLIEKFDPEKIITAVYLDNEKLQYNVKRFKIETNTLNSKFLFIKEGEGNYLLKVTTLQEPVLAMQSGRGAQIRRAKIKLNKMVEVMGWRAIGGKLTDYSKSDQMDWVEPTNLPEQKTLFE